MDRTSKKYKSHWKHVERACRRSPFSESVLRPLQFALDFLRDSPLEDRCGNLVDGICEGDGPVVTDVVAVAFVF